MEILLFLLLCIPWPLFVLFNICVSPFKARQSDKPAAEICKEAIENNTKRFKHDIELVWASSKDYTDMWTRDVFFTMFINKDNIIRTLAHFQRKDGLIPLYIGQGNACLKMFCGQRPSGKIHAFYADAKTENEPTDSCFQFIIMVMESQDTLFRANAVGAWNYMQSKINQTGLIYEHGLGTWQDTIKHKGNILYTNILYYRATQLLYPYKAPAIREAIFKHLWNGCFFKCSTTNDSFGQVGNALAILYGLTNKQQKNSIIDIHNTYFPEKWPSPNKKINLKDKTTSKAFEWYEVYLPCYPLGNSNYHNGWSWAWVNILFQKVHQKHFYGSDIQKWGTMYEVYDNKGQPIRTLLYKSQPDFSEACGVFLDINTNQTLKL